MEYINKTETFIKNLRTKINNKTKIIIYKSFGEKVRLCYLHEVSDARTRLLCNLCSGTHGLMWNWVDIEVEMVSV